MKPDVPINYDLTLRTEIRCNITELGVKKYLSLIRKKRNERGAFIVTLIILIAAVISAFFAWLTYHRTFDTNNQKPHRIDTTTRQQIAIPYRSLRPDTTKAQKRKP